MNNLLFIVVFVLAIIFYIFGVQICPIYFIFDVPCIGCGLTRSIVCLLRGEFVESVKYNILGIPLVLFFILYFVLCICGKKDILLNFSNKYKEYIIIMAAILAIIIQIININNPLLYS